MRWAAGLRVAGVPLNGTPARVINLSVGSIDACSVFEQQAIDEVVSRGVSIVIAAGNSAADVANTSPANCNHVITVAATSRSGARTTYTNTGKRVDLSAPGGTVANPLLVLQNTGLIYPGEDAIAYQAGTSLAAGQVTGVVALMLAQNPGLSPTQVEDILKSAARPFPDASCDTATCGAGILDAASALTLATQMTAESNVSDEMDGSSGGGGGCTLAAAAKPDPLFPALLVWIVVAYWRRCFCRRRANRQETFITIFDSGN
jgi:serine protease